MSSKRERRAFIEHIRNKVLSFRINTALANVNRMYMYIRRISTVLAGQANEDAYKASGPRKGRPRKKIVFEDLAPRSKKEASSLVIISSVESNSHNLLR